MTLFLHFSRFKTNLTKSEIGRIGVLERFEVAFYGVRCIDLKNNTLKISGTHFSYNKKLKEENNFYKTVIDIHTGRKKPLSIKQ